MINIKEEQNGNYLIGPIIGAIGGALVLVVGIIYVARSQPEPD
jgi:hypothetical protein